MEVIVSENTSDVRDEIRKAEKEKREKEVMAAKVEMVREREQNTQR